MAANINRVVLVGNLTKDPELRHTPRRYAGLQPAHRGEQPAARRVGQLGRQAELLQRLRLRQPGRELRAVPLEGPPRRDRRPARLARVGGEGRRRASARPSRSSPTASSSSAAAATATAAAAATSSCRRARAPRRAPTSRPRPTTTSRSRRGMAQREESAAAAEAARRPCRGDQAPELLLLQGARSPRSTTRTSTSCGATSRRRGRSAAAASPAPAAATRCRSRPP